MHASQALCAIDISRGAFVFVLGVMCVVGMTEHYFEFDGWDKVLHTHSGRDCTCNSGWRKVMAVSRARSISAAFHVEMNKMRNVRCHHEHHTSDGNYSLQKIG